METIDFIIAAIIQGITEFLPVSSSGHVLILSKLLGYETRDLFHHIYLHFGSLIAVLFVFRQDLLRLFKSERRMLLLILAGSIPVLIVGFFAKEAITPYYRNARLAGFFLILNGVWLLTAHIKERTSKKEARLNLRRSVIIGISQTFALLPGISRSGATIGSGLFLGMDRVKAYRYSFLLFIPAALAALFYDLSKADNFFTGGSLFNIVVGGIICFIVSVASLKVLLSVLKKSKLYLFGIYCVIAGLIAMVFK